MAIIPDVGADTAKPSCVKQMKTNIVTFFLKLQDDVWTGWHV